MAIRLKEIIQAAKKFSHAVADGLIYPQYLFSKAERQRIINQIIIGAISFAVTFM